MSAAPPADLDAAQLKARIREWALELGFQQCGVARVHLPEAEAGWQRWLAQGRHGGMHYMARHAARGRPAELLPGTLSVLSLRMDYWPEQAAAPWPVLQDAARGYVARYALGRDYHKLLRRRLQRLARRIDAEAAPHGWRVFCDSAPVLEKPLAQSAGLGWQGKHTNLIHRSAGSWFFLGEIFTTLPLPPDDAEASHCGSCTACISACPTGAITAAYELDARLCISYLTIELHGAIPEPLRPLLGNRIYGCDDCQLVCPWNKFARPSAEGDFAPRHGLDSARLVELFAWDETEFLRRTEGSPIRRLGHLRWLRNIAVALGNGAASGVVVAALQARAAHASELVREHAHWALRRLMTAPA
jgi:epoxyqueuosine reductase